MNQARRSSKSRILLEIRHDYHGFYPGQIYFTWERLTSGVSHLPGVTAKVRNHVSGNSDLATISQELSEDSFN